MNAIRLDEPSAQYLKLAEELIAEETAKLPVTITTTDEMQLDSPKSEETLYHERMQELEQLHIELYQLLRDPRFNKSSGHDEHIKSVLDSELKRLQLEFEEIENERTRNHNTTKATIIALENKLKISKQL